MRFLMSLFIGLSLFVSCSNNTKNDAAFDKSLSVDGEIVNPQTPVNVQPRTDLLEESSMANEMSNSMKSNHDVEIHNNVKTKEIQITLKDVLFKFNSTSINKRGKKALNQVVATMKKYPKSIICITGHSDNIGKKKAKARIALGRAKAVAQYITSHGIKSSRVHYIGMSDKKPLVRNNSSGNRQKNRRVELEIRTKTINCL